MFHRGSTASGVGPDHGTMTTLGSLTTNLVILAAFVAVVLIGLKIAQSIFGVGSTKAAAAETAARLVAYPTGSAAVLRRRFVKALTSQHVVMPSGDRLAFSALVVRVAPEDLERLDPDGDTERLGEDAARLYRTHAEREGWALPADVHVSVEVDPGLRSGWVPPARGSRGAGADRRPLETATPSAAEIGTDDPLPVPDWDAVGRSHDAAPVVHPSRRDVPLRGDATMAFPVLVPDDPRPTVTVAGDLLLHRGAETVTVPRTGVTTLGRLAESPLHLDEPEVSYRHAAIRLHGPTWQVMDVGSTNGTTVDGERIGDDWTPLVDGSVLALAGVRVTVGTDARGTVAVREVSRLP